MISGYLLRDVINKVSGIHFTSSDEIHTLGHLYESMLREMRDAAGDSGEFYTPRAVVRFMVEVIDPQLGEVGPRPGLRHRRLSRRVVQAPRATVSRRSRTATVLQKQSIFGGEAKSLPYLLAQMNLSARPRIAEDRPAATACASRCARSAKRPRRYHPDQPALRRRGRARHPRQLPRGPADRRNGAAVPPAHHAQAQTPPKPGRAAVVVPNGTLFGDGICARIKEELLKDFNLHTIVRLPEGVFAPYTGIPTNIIFFDRSGPTKDVWYYEIPAQLPKQMVGRVTLAA